MSNYLNKNLREKKTDGFCGMRTADEMILLENEQVAFSFKLLSGFQRSLTVGGVPKCCYLTTFLIMAAKQQQTTPHSHTALRRFFSQFFNGG